MLCLPPNSAFTANHNQFVEKQSIMEDVLIVRGGEGPTVCTKHAPLMTGDAFQSI